MALAGKQKRFLRALAHSMDPVVQIGSKGMGSAQLEQISDQLLAHELIKVRFNTSSAVEPVEARDQVVAETGCELVDQSGRMLILYKRREHKPSIQLPKE